MAKCYNIKTKKQKKKNKNKCATFTSTHISNELQYKLQVRWHAYTTAFMHNDNNSKIKMTTTIM